MQRARYDPETAKAMEKSGRYLYVLFCCQQSIEKALKSLIVKRSGKMPPRIHLLPKLANIAGLDMEADRTETLSELSAYYIQSRYPEDIEDMGKSIKPEQARQILKQSTEIIQWLESMM